ncbi:hypothetical protein B0H16DRAFT_1719370 [Mycena metata]|uniref:Uncharacterized protein n=1 Tax=Mycena metata TaxID=1033252 RepID=A0AAD7NID9_9AGAR|nr:hypothetical protein B0H16DRAFT_1719370 [Mycena metata]
MYPSLCATICDFDSPLSRLVSDAAGPRPFPIHYGLHVGSGCYLAVNSRSSTYIPSHAASDVLTPQVLPRDRVELHTAPPDLRPRTFDDYVAAEAVDIHIWLPRLDASGLSARSSASALASLRWRAVAHAPMWFPSSKWWRLTQAFRQHILSDTTHIFPPIYLLIQTHISSPRPSFLFRNGCMWNLPASSSAAAAACFLDRTPSSARAGPAPGPRFRAHRPLLRRLHWALIGVAGAGGGEGEFLGARGGGWARVGNGNGGEGEEGAEDVWTGITPTRGLRASFATIVERASDLPVEVALDLCGLGSCHITDPEHIWMGGCVSVRIPLWSSRVLPGAVAPVTSGASFASSGV